MLRVLLTVAVCFVLPAPADAVVQTKTVRYKVGDVEFHGHLAWDDAITGARPGVLVVHEWWGLNDYARRRAEQLAELGYIAFAADLYGEGKLVSHPADARQMATAVRENVENWRARALASLDVLKQQPLCDPKQLAAIGYCFGGATVLQLAYTGAEVDAIVSFHGSLPAATDEQAQQIKGSILVCHGALDTFVPEDAIRQFRTVLDENDADYQMIYYSGTKHSFTDPEASDRGIDGLAYHRLADERSWKHMLTLFREKFGGHSAR